MHDRCRYGVLHVLSASILPTTSTMYLAVDIWKALRVRSGILKVPILFGTLHQPRRCDA